MRSTLSGKACLWTFLLLLGVALPWTVTRTTQRTPADPDGYARIARNLASHGEFASQRNIPTAYRPPGYVLAITPFHWMQCQDCGVWYLHLGFRLATIWGSYLLATRMGARGVAYIAAALVALDPILVWHTGLVMSETLFTMLFVFLLILYANVDRDPLWSVVMSGVVLAAAALTRPVAIAIWVGIGIASLLASRWRSWCLVTVIAFLVYLPWPIRNQIVLDELVWTTTHGGYTLWLGMNPEYFKQVVAGPSETWPEESFHAWTDANLAAIEGLSEVQADRYFRAQAIDWMQNHPRDAVLSILHHLGSIWNPMPHVGRPWQRWTVASFYAALFIMAIIGLIRGSGWQWPRSILVATIFAVTVVHLVYWSNIRMRAPLSPVVATLASLAFVLGRRPEPCPPDARR